MIRVRAVGITNVAIAIVIARPSEKPGGRRPAASRLACDVHVREGRVCV